jgi:hypothetical protein
LRGLFSGAEDWLLDDELSEDESLELLLFLDSSFEEIDEEDLMEESRLFDFSEEDDALTESSLFYSSYLEVLL